jgi:homoserine dehydrogenase
VGGGVWNLLEGFEKELAHRYGLKIRVKKVLVRDVSKVRSCGVPQEVLTTCFEDVEADSEISIVVELIGGIEPATEYMAEALKNGKSVVTANKAAIAANGPYLAKLAQDNHVLLRFEAAVAGGIPILTSLTTALLSNRFTELHGILNGTTNYILTQMSEYGKDYAEVLADAQAKGFAEADPTADVEGLDAANKLSILISLIFGISVPPEKIDTTGITRIASEDMAFAAESGYKIKLLASARENKGKVTCSVGPVMLPKSHPLASVSNEFNAVFVNGNAVDDLMFYGRGAGPLPTGSAVLGDIIGVARKQGKHSAYDIVPQLSYDADLQYLPETESKFYVRMTVADKPGVLGRITTLFGYYDISVEAIQQRPPYEADGERVATLIFILFESEKSRLVHALNEVLKLETTKSIDNMIRVESN